MASTAVYLIAQHRDMIVGEGVDDDIGRAIRELTIGDEKFLSVRAAHSVYFGPETVLVAIEAEFDRDRKAGELIDAVDRIQRSIRERYPAVKYIYVDPESDKTKDGARRPAA
jgi:divalent metal cation (Fe/Co/Zn/Cd) transporter